MTALVPLVAAGRRCGAKASTLGRLTRAGFAVPPGVVVPDADDPAWLTTLAPALEALGGGPFAVRSSAPVEDGPDASFAGQFATVLDVRADDVREAVYEVAASAARPIVASYAERRGRLVSPPGGRLPVLIQPMVDAVAAGVLTTRHPVTGAQETVVEAVAGTGRRIVDGGVEPDRWTVPRGATEPAATTDALLDASTLARLVRVGDAVERLLGGPQDVEWALAADGTLAVLQARPMTALRARTHPRDEGPSSLTGTPASPGRATGTARTVRDLDDAARLRPGDVLVCRATSPAWTPLLARAAAVVTETGGILAHAAIVAREFGVPAVTSVPDAMAAIPDGADVTVDGAAGTVTVRGGRA